ncbi:MULTISPECIES: hypothetical protein [unclassified Sphingomonas]|uniref:hypothetical protein n=1 Tax=unclassified Sphingomonas TaxID=196159 RepID=UPI000927DD98|nr:MULTISPECIES: hypothetical protein [unclassified Sphingomonas]OJU16351.1 MAG: hypothetical protein BGN95_04275 [Sphingomonas sp. 66-10]
MLNIVSILIGLVALLFAVPGVIPLLGWLNWAALPIAAVGALFGMLSSSDSGRNFNLIVLVIAIVRLALGGGIL